MNIFNIVRNIIFPSKVAWIFITDSKQCQCDQMFEMAKAAGIQNVYKITNLESIDETLKNIFKSSSKLLIFAHGDINPYMCFYKTKLQNREVLQDIPHNWWSTIINSTSIIYFHVCFGSLIIGNTELKERIPKWISYNSLIYFAYSSTGLIHNSNKSFLQRLESEMIRRKTLGSISSAIESAYGGMKSDLLDADGYSIPNKRFMITQIGNNINSLNYSQA